MIKYAIPGKTGFNGPWIIDMVVKTNIQTIIASTDHAIFFHNETFLPSLAGIKYSNNLATPKPPMADVIRIAVIPLAPAEFLVAFVPMKPMIPYIKQKIMNSIKPLSSAVTQ